MSRRARPFRSRQRSLILCLVRCMGADKQSARELWVAASVAFLVSLGCLFLAYNADLHHTFIRGGQRRLEPWQGYVGGIFLLGGSAWLASEAIRLRNRK